MKKVASIIRSTSHQIYVAQVVNPRSEVNPNDYALGKFVRFELDLVGLIYDTELFNPLALSYTEQKEEQAVYVPDLKDETNIFIKLLLLGSICGGCGDQRLPDLLLEAGVGVFQIEPEKVRDFHLDRSAKFQLKYLSQLKEVTGGINLTILDKIKKQLHSVFDHKQLKILELVERDLKWQSFAVAA
ncbi:MAG: hypothetical protein SFT81_00530 [Candidatus Caenarcaniphilales bacterium]|nr:hypothetical protein [Candidatus Caenarcaniphilales bacterium]